MLTVAQRLNEQSKGHFHLLNIYAVVLKDEDLDIILSLYPLKGMYKIFKDNFNMLKHSGLVSSVFTTGMTYHMTANKHPSSSSSSRYSNTNTTMRSSPSYTTYTIKDWDEMIYTLYAIMSSDFSNDYHEIYNVEECLQLLLFKGQPYEEFMDLISWVSKHRSDVSRFINLPFPSYDSWFEIKMHADELLEEYEDGNVPKF